MFWFRGLESEDTFKSSLEQENENKTKVHHSLFSQYSNEAVCTLLAVGHYSLQECLKIHTALPHNAPYGHLQKKWSKSLVIVARIKTVWARGVKTLHLQCRQIHCATTSDLTCYIIHTECKTAGK